jgi:hypothetical protein
MERRKFLQRIFFISIVGTSGGAWFFLGRSKVDHKSALELQILAAENIGLSVKCAIRNGGYPVIKTVVDEDVIPFGYDQIQVLGYLMDKNEFDQLNNWLLLK